MSCRIDGKWGLIFTYGPGNNDVVSRGSLKQGEARKLGYTYATNGKHFERARGKPSFSSQTVRLVKAYELESREMQNLLELLLC